MTHVLNKQKQNLDKLKALGLLLGLLFLTSCSTANAWDNMNYPITCTPQTIYPLRTCP